MLSKIIVTTVAVTGASSVIYLIHFYHSLSRKVQHSHFVGQLPPSSSSSTSSSTSSETSRPSDADESSSTRSSSSSVRTQVQTIQSLPPTFHTLPQNYHIFYDSCSKTVSSSALPPALLSNPSQLLTSLLRRNMSLFATRLPQAWLLRLLISRKCPSLLPSFAPAHIRTLEFEPGDVVVGMYRVVVRTATKVEFDIWVPPGSGIELPPVEGRLVISVVIGDGEESRGFKFMTQTLQWRRSELKGVVLPLERTAFRWLHDLASWWLVDSGVAWLSQVE